MDFLAPYHPIIVHTPIALIITSALFDIVGRAVGLDWWRKAAVAMLVVGALGAWAAVLSGQAAEDHAKDQGVPKAPIEAHEDVAKLALWAGLAAVLARLAASRLTKVRAAASGLALAIHLLAAVLVGITGFRGGKLVYEHGAGVKVAGQPVQSDGAQEPEGEGARE